MKLFYSIILFLISGLVCSGQSYVDSIEIELKTAVSNEERISLIERYLYDLTYHNPDTALYYANYGIEIIRNNLGDVYGNKTVALVDMLIGGQDKAFYER